MPLTFFYPEYEGKRTSPQAYVKEAIRRQQEINEQETAGNKRTMQEEHWAGTNETAQEI